MKYIDAEKLKKIVEQAKQRALKGAEVDEDMYCDGRADAFGQVLLEIDSLQQDQPEVDLEKEIDSEWAKCNPIDEGMGDESALLVIEQFHYIAHHFYELGLNTRKEDQ